MMEGEAPASEACPIPMLLAKSGIARYRIRCLYMHHYVNYCIEVNVIQVQCSVDYNYHITGTAKSLDLF